MEKTQDTLDYDGKAPGDLPRTAAKETRGHRERIGLVVNDLPSAESKAPSQFGGVLLASVPAHTSPRTRATTHTLLSLSLSLSLSLRGHEATWV